MSGNRMERLNYKPGIVSVNYWSENLCLLIYFSLLNYV